MTNQLTFRKFGMTAGLVFLACFLVGCASAQQPKLESKIPLENCQISSTLNAVQVSARCGTWQVFENRATQSGRKIQLHVALIKATSNTPARDPLFLLAGGPGEAATESFAPLVGLLQQVNLKRDLVLVDQRGTGESHPLTCKSSLDPEKYFPGEKVPPEVSAAETARCLQQLDADPRWYTTEIAMQDLDEIRQALGYEKINLLGVSYGTRAAQVYLRLFPQNVRTLILDGVVPPGWVLGSTVSQDAQHALDLIFARCQADTACSTAFPDLPGQFRALRERLKKEAPLVTLPNPLTAAPAQVRLTPEVLSGTLRMMSYSSETAALIPLMIHTANTVGDLKPLAAQYFTAVEPLGEAISQGMYLSVTCAEDTPFLIRPEKPVASYFDYSLEEVQAGCRQWPHLDLDANWNAPLRSDVPALILSGSADPVTPPANGEALARLLPNSKHVVVQGSGHGNFFRGCMPRVIQNFLKDGSAQNLDTSCMDKVKPLPFFTSLVGPQP
jgi:pimeloyl-ACP methyl ester carboxylesterase